MAFTCASCSFDLWEQIYEDEFVAVGLYDDARFPGRLLVVLKPHYDHLDEVPAEEAAAFTWECQRLAKALREALPSPRINQAVLGNAVAHVHAHLIPRQAEDPLPHSSPWDDPRPRANLSPPAKEELVARLREGLAP